jgi:exodeoxyribonuclease V beta subunit
LSGEDEIGVDEQPALAASLPQVDGIDPCGELQSAAFQQSHWPSCWWQSSFSALVRGQQVHLADQPELSDHSDDADTVDSVEDAPGQCHDIFHLPRGANTGECLHAIFEHWDFNASHEHQQDALILRFLSRYDIGDIEDRFNWVPPVMQMVKACLAHPLSGGAGPLKNVPASRQQAEMGFLMHAETSLSQIRDGLLAIPDWPEPFREACQQLSEKQLRGFLKGFIDLTFQDEQGRYHVLDWKSNHLGYRPQDYGQDAMEKAMAEHHYYLQAIIYLLALHRWLGQRLTDYAPEQHLGDAWYLFVRGVNGTPDHGVYRMSLSPDQIRTLDNLLSGEVRAA